MKMAVFVITIMTTGYFLGLVFDGSLSSPKKQYVIPQDSYTRFAIEVFDLIRDQYWKEVDEKSLTLLYKRAFENYTEKLYVLDPLSKIELSKLIYNELSKLKSDEEKAKLIAGAVDLVLKNLEPFGRNQLYRKQDSQKLNSQLNPENSITAQQFHERILYLRIKSFAHNSYGELQGVMRNYIDRTGKLNTLVVDLRDNIGGSIDILPNFLGPFIGKNRIAYHFFAREKQIPFKTLVGWLDSLVQYKRVVFLINRNTQSTAEVFASVMKNYNVGLVIGERSRGWGSVEKVIQLENQIDAHDIYSVFLVHHLTLDEEGQPIEGRGVQPYLHLRDFSWQKTMVSHFNDKILVQFIKQLWSAPPQ